MEDVHHGKLNQLQRLVPEGLLVDSRWLERHGYPSALRQLYLRRGWLEHPVHGVFRRRPAHLAGRGPDTTLRWQHVVISLQSLLDCPLVVGGRTALELQGFAHYVSSAGPQEIHLHGNASPPTWLRRLKLDVRFVFHRASALFDEAPPVLGAGGPNSTSRASDRAGADRDDDSVVRQPWGHWDWPLILSTPERALLELLDEVPQRESFHQADVLIEGLRNISPRRLHRLLVACRSVKVKRLAFFFAQRHRHAWLKHLDRAAIDLGKGKRMLIRGGRLDPTYLITVPEELHAGA